MLAKLIKYECKAAYKFLLLLNFFTLIFSLIGGIVITLQMQNYYFPILLYWAFTLAYIVLIWSSVLGTQIYLARRFYTSCFSNEGYLTFTLPASPSIIFLSKVLTTVFWTLINAGFTLTGLLLSVLIPMFQGVPISELSSLLSYMEIDVSIIIKILVVLIIGILSNILLIDFSLCMGQLANKHRIFTTILSYGITFIIIQILHSIFSYSNSIYFSMETSSSAILSNIFTSSNIISIATILVLYVLSVFILKKKLNLT